VGIPYSYVVRLGISNIGVVNCSYMVALVRLAMLPLSHWYCHPHCAGVATLIVLMSLPLLCWHRCYPLWCLQCCLRHSTCVVALVLLVSSIVLASLSLSCWLCCPHCAGAVALIMLALSPLSWCSHCFCCPGIFVAIVRASLLSLRLCCVLVLSPSLHWHCHSAIPPLQRWWSEHIICLQAGSRPRGHIICFRLCRGWVHNM